MGSGIRENMWRAMQWSIHNKLPRIGNKRPLNESRLNHKKIWTRRWRLKKLGKWFNKSTNLEPMWPVSTHAPMNGTKFSWRRSRIWKSIVENADNNYFAFLADRVAYIHTYCTSMDLILGHSKSCKLMCSFIILAGNCHFIA